MLEPAYPAPEPRTMVCSKLSHYTLERVKNKGAEIDHADVVRYMIQDFFHFLCPLKKLKGHIAVGLFVRPSIHPSEQKLSWGF